MPKTYTVKQGDHMSGIAAENGFADFRVIWEDGANAEIRKLRDSHVLFPGDKIVIPDRKDKVESKASDSAHVFEVDIPQLFLRCRLLDIDAKPIANAPCDVAVQLAADETVPTDGNGIVEHPIARRTRNGEINAHIPPPPPPAPPPVPEKTAEFDLRIGSLNPLTKASGQQARLNNLGYYAGFSVKDLDQLLWAAEEFECDKVQKPVKKRPLIVPAPPQGEDDGTADPVAPTGITDGNLLKALKKEHGI